MEHLLRVISWTVVLAAVFALAWAGFKPVFKDLGFPPVDESQVRGSMLSQEDKQEMDSSSAVAQVECDSSNEEQDCVKPKRKPEP